MLLMTCAKLATVLIDKSGHLTYQKAKLHRQQYVSVINLSGSSKERLILLYTTRNVGERPLQID